MKCRLFLICLVLSASVFAKEYELDAATKQRIKQSAIRFFETDEVLNLTVRADFNSIRADRDRTTNDYHTATIQIQDDLDTLFILVKIKTRGNFRLKVENCDFPPLRFNFKKRDVINTVFEGQDKLKLVTHCRDTSEAMQNTMLKEYLVYRLYNVISEKSLKVRLVKVKYVDVNYGELFSKYAFFIESVDQMAERLGCEEVEMANLKQDQLVEENIIKLALFNYMIGNTDWSVPKLHNVTLLRSNRHAPPVAIPYDFDMCEFVNASYMHMYMGRELLENRYKGKKVSKESLDSAILHFQENRKKMINTVLGFEYLALESKQECLNLIDSFYKTIDDRQASRKAFIAEASK